MPIPEDKNVAAPNCHFGFSFFDPYYTYLTSRPVHKYVGSLLTDPDYTIWNFYGDVSNKRSVTEQLAPRDGTSVVTEDPEWRIYDLRQPKILLDREYFPKRDLRSDMMDTSR